MRPEFLHTFNSFREYIGGAVPELGSIITHWEDPFQSSKSRCILLPDSHAEAGDDVVFSLALWAFTVEKNADTIARTQIGVMEKIYEAVYSGNVPAPVIGAVINSADYFDPAPQSPGIGVMRVSIKLTVEVLDDCD